jgi:hypothetical protein
MPLWAIGKHVSAISIWLQTVNTTTGVLADASTAGTSFFGHSSEISLDTNVSMENISAMDRPWVHNVVTETDTTLKITELEKSAGTNLAASLAFSGSYVRYVVTRGAQSFTGFGVLGDYSMNSSGKGSVKGDLTIRQIDIGTAAPLVYG